MQINAENIQVTIPVGMKIGINRTKNAKHENDTTHDFFKLFRSVNVTRNPLIMKNVSTETGEPIMSVEGYFANH